MGRHSGFRIGMMLAVTLAWCVLPTMGALKVLNFDDLSNPDICNANTKPPMFNRPEYGSQTAPFVVDPAACGQGVNNPTPTNGSDSQLTAQVVNSFPHSNVLRFSWENPTNDESWARVIAQDASGVTPSLPNPTVYLGVGGKIRMRVAAYAFDATLTPSSSGQIELSLIVRETGRNLPLGVDGGTSGALELIGASSMGVGNTATTPVGGVVIPHDESFTFRQVEWEIISATSVRVRVDGVQDGADRPVLSWSGGDGSFAGVPFSRGVLNTLAIRKAAADDISKKWFIWVDDVEIDSGGVTDPVKVESPIVEYATSAIVENIDPTATSVQLYKNGAPLGSPATSFNGPGGLSHTFTFATPPWVSGNLITASQTVGGVPSAQSDPVTVSRAGALDDFSNGIVVGDTGSDPRTWYDVRADTYGTAAAATLNGSPAMKTEDSGYANGVYAVFPAVVPATGVYHLEADIFVNEAANGLDAIRAYEMGVKVNGAHRTGAYLDPIVGGQAGQAMGGVVGLTSANNNGLGTQHISTGQFTANAGDSLLVAFSTNVDAKYGANVGDPAKNWGYSDGSSANWGGSRPLIDNIELVGGPSCSDTPAVSIVVGPLLKDAGSVVVSNVATTATTVTVYANGTEIGHITGTPPLGIADGSTRRVTVTLDEPLAAHQSISATQTINNTKGCVSSSGPQVGSNQNAALRMTLGIRETGDTGPIGAIGGTTGAIEFLGASQRIGNSPQGKPLPLGASWQTLTFQAGVDPTVGSSLTGAEDGVLPTTGFAVLEHLAISAEPTANETGPYVLYIDNIKNGTTVIRGFENGQTLFRQPSFSSSTSGNMIFPPNSSVISDEQGENSNHSTKVNWQFLDEGDSRWIRLTTSGLGNPQIDLSQPISISFLLLPPGPPPPTCPDPFADVNADNAVDHIDFAAFQICFTGSNPAPGTFDEVNCRCFDRDNNGLGDGDVDTADFNAFNNCWTGPAPAPGVFDPACDD